MEKQILHFTVNEQALVVDEPIKISTNKVNYIQANFDLGTNWSGFDSVRAVWFNDFNCISTVLDSLGNCVVPFEVMKRKGNVKVNLVGSISEDDVLTDRLTSYPVVAVIVDCTAQITGANTSPITPSEFEQFAQRVHTDAERAEQGASNAETSAQNAHASEQNASNSAQSAHDDKIAIEQAIAEVIQQIEDFEQVQVVVNTLPPSSQATSDFTDGVLTLGIPQGVKGDTGNGIQSIRKTGTSGLVDTYTITYTDGQTTTFTVTNGAKGDTGNGIQSIAKTSTEGLVDTYTITYTNGNTTTFTVTNGEKGDKGDTGEVSQAEFDEAVSDLKSKLNEYEGVKPFPISSNLIDPSKVSAKGTFWNNGIEYHDTGTTGNTPKMVSVKMPCEPETIYYNALYYISNNKRIKNSNVTYLNYFKSDGTYISWEVASDAIVEGKRQGKFTTPQNAGYVMITYVAYSSATDATPSQKALVQKTSVPDEYVDYETYDLHTAKDEIESLSNKMGKAEVVTGISSYIQNGGVILNGGTWGAGPDSTSYMHIVVPCDADFTLFSIKAVQGQYFYMVAVKDYVRHSSAGETIQDTSDYWFKPVYVDSSKNVCGMVPKDAKYLLISSKSGDTSIISELTITKISNAVNTPYNINKFNVGAFNVRDFGDGTVEGCPTALVDENLPLWKNLISGWLNTDFINICEWRTKFDEDDTIDAYDALFKQFYPYKYEVISDNVAIQCLMSKHECIFTDLSYYGDVNRLVPMLITIIDGKSVAVVGWIQSATDTVANREKAYRNAATILGTFDKVVLCGDFNTEVGLEELEELTDRGYTLGNGGYWGTINTWPAVNPATPNDNIASKGCILELFETNENHITSDHLPVRAKFTL